jgi:hypothetical protein
MVEAKRSNGVQENNVRLLQRNVNVFLHVSGNLRQRFTNAHICVALKKASGILNVKVASVTFRDAAFVHTYQLVFLNDMCDHLVVRPRMQPFTF